MNTLKFAISAGAIKNQVKINEKIISEKTSICKDQLKEYNELKTEVSKKKEMFDAMMISQNTKVEELERTIGELVEEGGKLKSLNNTLQGQVDHYSKKASSQERELSKVKSDNKA